MDGTVIYSIPSIADATAYVLPPPPPPPAYKQSDGIWRCGQPCKGTCGGKCYHPIEVSHGDEHSCAGRLRILHALGEWPVKRRPT